jgi:hypothetical protein
MGFFDRFAKSFLGKKDADESSAIKPLYEDTSNYSETGLRRVPPPDAKSERSSETSSHSFDSFEMSSVAVAELPETVDVVETEPTTETAATNLFDEDFDSDLDDVFASLLNQESIGAPAEEQESPAATSSQDQAIVEDLFADIAANYARPVKNFIFELRRGTATKDWVDICRPAMQGITRAAEGMGLRAAAQHMVDFEAALSLASQSEERILSGELRDLLLWCYEDLIKVMPQAFTVGEEEQQREGIIIHSLLMQIPDVGRVTVEKLYRAGLTSLDTLFLARKEDLAVATGITVVLSERICEKFQAYRTGLQSNRDVADAGQRARLAEMVAELQRQHEGYVEASDNPALAAEKRDYRNQRQACVLWINVLLAEVGELELINELQKLSFDKRIQRLEEYLASPPATL